MTFFLILINILLSVVGQSLAKSGVAKIGAFTNMPIREFIIKALTSPLIVTGAGLYFFSALIWFMVLSKVELSVAYPSLSLGYIAILLVSYFFLGEAITLGKVAGVLLICSGVYLIFNK
jgi:drug/metabolite transporter (DMT)-like permease